MVAKILRLGHHVSPAIKRLLGSRKINVSFQSTFANAVLKDHEKSLTQHVVLYMASSQTTSPIFVTEVKYPSYQTKKFS